VSSASARAVDLERGECTGDDEDEVLGRDGGVDEPEALSGYDDVGEGVEPLVEVTRETAPG